MPATFADCFSPGKLIKTAPPSVCTMDGLNLIQCLRLISNPPQARNTIERHIRADHRLLVEAAKACDPVVVFPKALPCGAQFAVHVRRRLRDASVQRVDLPPLEIIPSRRG